MIKTLDNSENIQLLKNNYLGRLGFIWLQLPYILPITYFYSEKDRSIISYSEEGHKIQSMRKNPMVSFEVEEIESVNNWSSALVHGTYEELGGSEAKKQLHVFAEGVKSIINDREHQGLKYISEFSSKINTGKIPIVFQIKIHGISGRMRRR